MAGMLVGKDKPKREGVWGEGLAWGPEHKSESTRKGGTSILRSFGSEVALLLSITVSFYSSCFPPLLNDLLG